MRLISIGAFFSKIAGVTFENRQLIIYDLVSQDKMEIGQELYLVPDPENKYDHQAVKVMHPDGMQLGFLPQDIAHRVFPDFQNGVVFRASVSGVTGGGADQNIGVNLKIEKYTENILSSTPADTSDTSSSSSIDHHQYDESMTNTEIEQNNDKLIMLTGILRELDGDSEIVVSMLLGMYDQGYGKEPIEWKVLRKEDTRYLLISKDALETAPFNKTYMYISWYDCSLNSWLNSEFLYTAFTERERDLICPHLDSGKTAKVFLLSVKEADKYFHSDIDRSCVPSEKIKSRVWVDRDDNCWWWLRSKGDQTNQAAYIENSGAIRKDGEIVNYDDFCVRPAIWIDISNYESEKIVKYKRSEYLDERDVLRENACAPREDFVIAENRQDSTNGTSAWLDDTYRHASGNKSSETLRFASKRQMRDDWRK